MFICKYQFKSMVKKVFGQGITQTMKRKMTAKLALECLEGRTVPATLLWVGGNVQNMDARPSRGLRAVRGNHRGNTRNSLDSRAFLRGSVLGSQEWHSS